MPAIELWLRNIGLEKYADVFARHDIDLEVAPNLSEQDLDKLGLSLGHRRKFLTAVAKLRAGDTQTTDHPTQVDAPRPEAAVERRQVTVVFSDLVGSTALTSQLDPEDMIGTPSVETFCGGLALRLGPKIATNAGGKPITAGIDWLSRSISPQQTEQMLNATQRFLEYVAED